MMITPLSPVAVRPQGPQPASPSSSYTAPTAPPPVKFGFDAQESGKWMLRFFYGTLAAVALAAGSVAVGVGYWWGKPNPPAVQQPDQPTQQPAEVE